MYFCVHIIHIEGGTLFHASDLVNRLLISDISITIIDGQNEEVISSSNYSSDYGYNPCIPLPIAMDKRMTMTFSSNITSFTDWFPSICKNESGLDNVYIFDGGQTWSIQKLIVEDYVASDWYYIMQSGSEYADIECIDCVFTNITNDGSSYHLFDTFGSLHFVNSQFTNITTTYHPMISGTHSYYDTGVTREFSIVNCTFTDIVSSWALLSCTLTAFTVYSGLTCFWSLNFVHFVDFTWATAGTMLSEHHSTSCLPSFRCLFHFTAFLLGKLPTAI